MDNNEFPATILCFDKKGSGDETQSGSVLVEVTDLTKTGLVEIAFTDRNERCYLKFRLADLMQYMCEAQVSGE